MMPPTETGSDRAEALVPGKRQPWKDHWDALAASEPTSSGTSHGFGRGEPFVMDGNVHVPGGGVRKSNDEKEVGDTKENDDTKEESDTEERDAKEGGAGTKDAGDSEDAGDPRSDDPIKEHKAVKEGGAKKKGAKTERHRRELDLPSCNECYWAPGHRNLKHALGAKFVIPLDFCVRRRHESFPISTGEEYEYNQPTAMAHIDFTVREGERMINVLFGEHAGKVLQSRWQIVNAWRPIRGPLKDWPLGLCDTRTVDFESDTMPGDIVFREFFTENMQIHYSSKHVWYWLPEQTVDEVLLFKSAESDATCPQGA
ncbi:hypothetical protein PG984_008044 [Apiospora sp. TS-2023a]